MTRERLLVLENSEEIYPPHLRLGRVLTDYLTINGNPNATRLELLDAVTQELLGTDLEAVMNNSATILVPHINNGQERKILEISSASTSSDTWNAEDSMRKSEEPRIVDIPGAIGSRRLTSSKKGDTVVISSQAERDTAETVEGVEIIDIFEEQIDDTTTAGNYYYKQDALLALLINNSDSPAVNAIVAKLKENPVVNVYSLDEETVVLLTALLKKAGLEKIDINANSAEVSVNLTDKSYRYPTVNDAWRLETNVNPTTMQNSEWELTRMAVDLNMEGPIDTVPGYSVNYSEDEVEFRKDVMRALMMHKLRYGFDKVWRKPSRGTDGGNQGSIDINLIDENRVLNRIRLMIKRGHYDEAIHVFDNHLVDLDKQKVNQAISTMHESKNDWVIEAYTKFLQIPIKLNGKSYMLDINPSVHNLNGVVKKLLTLQLTDRKMDGTKPWGGNLILDKKGWVEMMQHAENVTDEEKETLINSFDEIVTRMQTLIKKVLSSSKYTGGYVRGGMDVALARLGGNFNDEIVIAMQDNNARANGAETAYALYEEANIHSDKNAHAVTRNISPNIDFANMLGHLYLAIEKVQEMGHEINFDQVRLIGLSAGWGQFGLTGDSPVDILEKVLLIEKYLRENGAIK